MGPHRSGTHALAEYVRRFFEVDQQPQVRRPRGRLDEGTLVLAGGFTLWKHTVPLAPVGVPAAGAEGGPVLLLLMIRDVQSWMSSLSQHAFEIYPMRRRRRVFGSMEWMLEEVQMRTVGGGFADPFAGAAFASVPELWAVYAAGCLSGILAAAAAGRNGPTLAVVRFEDVVQRPGAVVDELERLGLPRNTMPFQPVEESASGSFGSRRASLVHSIHSGTAAQRLANEGLVGDVRRQLERHRHLFEKLGYAFP